jgi:N6-adenosine-specific RNA methylase IME4
VIVEDFEWDFEVRSRQTGMDRHAANHYPVSEDAHTAEEIIERTRDRFACAADDCVLFMWATVPFLAVAIDVMRQRGFRYVSSYVWGKEKIGTGYWSRNKHEYLLVGVRGAIPAPAPGTQWDSRTGRTTTHAMDKRC